MPYNTIQLAYDGGVATTKAMYHILRGDASWTPGGDGGWTDLSLTALIGITQRSGPLTIGSRL